MRVLQLPARIRVISREVLSARAEADALVSAARARAAALLEQARSEAEELREQARHKGAEAGRAEAVAALVAAEAVSSRADRDTQLVAELALEVARTVLGREAASGPEVVRDIARRALQRVRRARRVVIRVHPDDAAVVKVQVADWMPPGAKPEAIEIEADAAVDRGGVIVESELGRIDARLETQLAAIRRALGASQ